MKEQMASFSTPEISSESVRVFVDSHVYGDGQAAVLKFNEGEVRRGIIDDVENAGQISNFRVYDCRWTDEDVHGRVIWRGRAQVAVSLQPDAIAQVIVVSDNLSRRGLNYEMVVAGFEAA